ncbi:PHOsphatase, partial [Quaeritorhiza haematococci]
DMDFELIPKKSCIRWGAEVRTNATFIEQARLWKELHLPGILSSILNRYTHTPLPTLGLHHENVTTLFKACSFEANLFKRTSTWCSMFSKEDILKLEYYEDMHHYWLLGYGQELNLKVACALVTDVVKEMRELVEGTSQVKGWFRFGHSETNIFLMSLLGLFRDDHHLYANSTHEEIASRKFRMSSVSPMAGNIFFELYSCDDTSPPAPHHNQHYTYKKPHYHHTHVTDPNWSWPDPPSTYKIRLLVNEKPVAIPGCSGRDDDANATISNNAAADSDRYLCRLDTFVNLLKPHLGCDFPGLCRIQMEQVQSWRWKWVVDEGRSSSRVEEKGRRKGE